MTKAELRKSLPHDTPARYVAFVEAVENRLTRRNQRNASKIRKVLSRELHKYLTTIRRPDLPGYCTTQVRSHEVRRRAWEQGHALALAKKAGYTSDEHGTYLRGDHFSVGPLDFVPPWEAQVAPYCDLGGEGLALISVTRTRVYPKSSQWRPSSVATKFLIGRNEAGTYFAHPVSPRCNTVEAALDWIWGGKASDIIQRQGDVALIGSNGGPRMPASLPHGHVVDEAAGVIRHATHPDLPLPGKGQRIIVGRRAAERASAATRD